MDYSAIFRLAVERGWRLGLPLIVFCLLAQFTDRLSISLPPGVKEWTGAGLPLGVAIFVLSLFDNALNVFKRYRERKAAAAAEMRKRNEEAREMLANLEAFNHLENQALLFLLTSGQDRFEVRAGSQDWDLLRKGALISVRELERPIGGIPTALICKIHPAIIDRKQEIVRALGEKFGTGQQLAHLNNDPKQGNPPAKLSAE